MLISSTSSVTLTVPASPQEKPCLVQTWRTSYNKGEPLFACGFPSFCRFAPKIHLSCPFLNDKEVSSLASDDSGHRPKTPRAFEKARAKLSSLVCANMASRHIIKSVGSVLSDGFFPYSKLNFGLAQKKGLVAKPLFLKFFEGLETFF